jgi:hypothetical protein
MSRDATRLELVAMPASVEDDAYTPNATKLRLVTACIICLALSPAHTCGVLAPLPDRGRCQQECVSPADLHPKPHWGVVFI